MPNALNVPLSVLDIASIVSGAPVAQSLRDAVDLARRVEQLGYHRYWVAEHHNAPSVASTTPPVLIAQIANATSHIRVGAGGVMLPNHPALLVAEQFAMLEAFHPGRIDLGIGKGPGTDPATAQLLRRGTQQPNADDFAQQISELQEHFQPAEPDPTIVTKAALENQPPIWLLGSSPSSATMAGELGLPFAFAHHLKGDNAVPALAAYRAAFRPSAQSAKPYALVSALVIAADTDERAHWLAGPTALTMLHMRKGRFSRDPLASPAEAAEYPYSAEERDLVQGYLAERIIGGPETVRAKLADLHAQTQADELMIITVMHDFVDRVRCYELLVE